MSIATLVDASTRNLKAGTVVVVTGDEYIIIGHRSHVNYEIRRVRDGKSYLLRRSEGLQVDRFDADLLHKMSFAMGDIVRIKGKKFTGTVGVVAKVGVRYQVAVPGQITIIANHGSLEHATKDDLAASLSL